MKENTQYVRIISNDVGALQVLVSIMLFSVFAFVSLAIDIGIARMVHRRVTQAADASALAGVAMLKNETLTHDELIAIATAEAGLLAQANGVGNDEFSVVSIAIGKWNESSGAFLDQSVLSQGDTLNAVQVVTRKHVPIVFGRIFGMERLSPSARAIAVLSGASQVVCAVPYAVEFQAVQGKSFGDLIPVGWNSSGNWGKIDLGGENMSSGSDFLEAMEFGVCSEPVQIGDQISPATGFAQVQQGFQRRFNVQPIITIPVVTPFPNGNSGNVTVLGFIAGKLTGDTDGEGHHWSGDLELQSDVLGAGAGGPPGAPFAWSRALVL